MALFYSYFPKQFQTGDVVSLNREESHHLLRVLRYNSKDELFLFDGKGLIGKAKLLQEGKEAQFQILETEKFSQNTPQISLIQGLSKGPCMDLVVRQATELGVQKILIFEGDFSDVHLDETRLQHKLQRWESISIEACKQSKNPFLPEIEIFPSLKSLLEKHADASSTQIVASLTPNALPFNEIPHNQKKILLAVGPEGDFSPQEYECLSDYNFHGVRMGRQILTTETAAITLVALARFSGYQGKSI